MAARLVYIGVLMCGPSQGYLRGDFRNFVARFAIGCEAANQLGVDCFVSGKKVLVLVLVPAQGPNQETAGSTALTWLVMCCGLLGLLSGDLALPYCETTNQLPWSVFNSSRCHVTVDDGRSFNSGNGRHTHCQRRCVSSQWREACIFSLLFWILPLVVLLLLASHCTLLCPG